MLAIYTQVFLSRAIRVRNILSTINGRYRAYQQQVNDSDSLSAFDETRYMGESNCSSTFRETLSSDAFESLNEDVSHLIQILMAEFSDMKGFFTLHMTLYTIYGAGMAYSFALFMELASIDELVSAFDLAILAVFSLFSLGPTVKMP